MFRIGIPAAACAVVFGATICFGVPVLADSEANVDASPAEIQKAAEANPRICKRFKPTGSNIPQRYCFRKSKWDQMREDSQRSLRELSDRAAMNTGGAEGPR